MAGTMYDKRSACVKLLFVCSRVFFSVISKKRKFKKLKICLGQLGSPFPKSSVILTSTCGEIIGELGRI